VIDAEVVIVGGGPGGAACAWRLRQQGCRALVLDSQEFPRVKLCAGWITPNVLSDLEITPAGYPHPILKLGRLDVELFGARRSWRFRIDADQYSIRRYEFDHWLLERSGAEVVRHRAADVVRDGDRFVIDGRFRCRHLVGAGGTHCPVHRSLFREQNARSREYQVAALEQEFRYDYRDDTCHLWLGEHGLVGYAWYVPKGGGFVNVGIGGFCRYMDEASVKLPEHWGALTEKLSARGLVTAHRYQPKGHTYYVRERVTVPQIGRAYLVGDAAGLATRDLGEGIGPAVESGIRAADAIATGRQYSIAGITQYSLVARGRRQSILATLVDRRGLLFRDWVFGTRWRAKERRFRARRGAGATSPPPAAMTGASS
jgi:flavin-dependent dehydrogenase